MHLRNPPGLALLMTAGPHGRPFRDGRTEALTEPPDSSGQSNTERETS
jgi:hypothetical protein